MSWPWLLNTAWSAACSRERRAFYRATQSVAYAQADVLAAILRRNRHTQFGRAHGFSATRDVRDFQRQTPLSRYEDYAAAIAQLAAGQRGVLTRDRIELFEPTSGTTQGEKLIPYTAALRRQFQRAVAVWIADLFHQRPHLRNGRAYWSISPALSRRRTTEAGIPIGFAADAEYLAAAARWLLRRLLVAPAWLSAIADAESFRYCTLWSLLGAADLTLISIWNPTFLLILLEPLETWSERLCSDIAEGLPRPPQPLPAEIVRQLARGRCANAARADELRRIFAKPSSLPAKLRRIWPRLGLISCWADAHAASYLPELARLFPEVELQPKGLMATEGCISFPWIGRSGTALAIRSHFFEFQELDSAEGIRLAHELERGGRYRVVLTTGGGLYRYELRDVVEIVDFLNQCPLLQFLGKADCISDLVGEKLAEAHVSDVLVRLLRQADIAATFSLLAPAPQRPPRYRLYLQGPSIDAKAAAADEWARQLDRSLSENPHYRYARQLGQLAAAEIVILDRLGPSAQEVYQQQHAARGMRVGNIKPLALDCWTGWPALLETARPPNPNARRTSG